MTNVMLDPLPTEWMVPGTYKVYRVNCDYRIGIQIALVQDDKDLAQYEKAGIILSLMFDDEAEERPVPQGKSAEECIRWLMNGWYHDGIGSSEEKRKLIDYDVDQWRIYADFRSIYGVDLATEDMHWWKFCGLLWNMPHKQSSFLQAIEIRRKKKEEAKSDAEKKAIQESQKIYALEQPGQEYTEEEAAKIDEYDAMIARMKKKSEEEALKVFRK